MSAVAAPWSVAARAGPGPIATEATPGELAAAVDGGAIVVVKRAFDPEEMRRLRTDILTWRPRESIAHAAAPESSSCQRSEDPPGTPIRHVFESYLFAVNDPADWIGVRVRPVFERLAECWRALTGDARGFLPGSDGLAIRPRAMYYPAGGGYFDWHAHPLEPHRIGVILALSQPGVDFESGATEFRTPHGVVSTAGCHDIGDVCLFRYDLSHRVTPVDPGRERRWDGTGRWVFILPVQ